MIREAAARRAMHDSAPADRIIIMHRYKAVNRSTTLIHGGTVRSYHQNGRQRSEVISMSKQVQKSKYNLTTKARRAVVGRNEQLDEGAGRQTWKCLDPLNCVAPAAF